MQRLTLLVVSLGLALTACGDAADSTLTPCSPGFARTDASSDCGRIPATCDAGGVTSIAADCQALNRTCFADAQGAVCGACLPQFRDQTGSEVCVPVTDCGTLQCGNRGRVCIEAAANVDARCDVCLSGLVEIDGQCVQESCRPGGALGSILEDCNAQSRTCVTTADGASCDACWPGYVERAGECVVRTTCELLGCAAGNRACNDPGTGADAQCGSCLPGFVDEGGVCRRNASAVCVPSNSPQSIQAACDAAERVCLTDPAGATCGDCKTGFVASDETGLCEPRRTCAEVSCSAQNRACDDTVTARCTTCLPGFVLDPAVGGCRAVVTCTELSCAAGQECAAATDTTDAFCRVACGDRALWSGTRCEPCPRCDAPGEVGRWPWPTDAGQCICETEPGYFYSVSADVGSFRCDGDDDGWVRESARTALEATDAAIVANARCALRRIDRVELVNEAGESKTLPLANPLALYESDRNDDDVILDAVWAARGLPQYGVGGRRVRAHELNRMTKLCHDPRTDYNDNGAPDVEEWADRPLGPSMRPDQAPFNAFSYYAELHWGRYQAGASASMPGRYVIQEKTRSASTSIAAERRVSVAFDPANDGDYWRTCTLERDSDFGTLDPPIGLDFASYPPETGFGGMELHSLFKCVVIDNEPDPGIPTQITAAEAAAAGYRLNRCGAEADPVRRVQNPSESSQHCDLVDPAQAEPGDAFWAAVPFIDYGPDAPAQSTYVRGCVNECIAQLPQCPGYSINPAAVDCEYDRDDFGKFVRCDAFEVCDGFDNTADGNIDEGDPGGGVACVTTEPGVCRPGTTRCVGGQVVCRRNVNPSAELCDNLDNNCNGQVDENNPQGGVVGCNTPGQGICRAGVLDCANGSLSVCRQLQAATDENGARSCDNLDNDCNGTVDDEPSPAGQCTSPRTRYYTDADNDTYGVNGDTGRCLCRPDGNHRATRRQDCCDSDAGARPGASFSTSRTACQLYDWNCDGVEEKQYNSAPKSGCGICAFCGCNDSADGWSGGSVAGCGETASYYSGCNWVCEQQTTNRTQACK